MTFTDHAKRCGIDMAGKQAVSLISALIAPDMLVNLTTILHPETLATLALPGDPLTDELLATLRDAGVDYVVVSSDSVLCN